MPEQKEKVTVVTEPGEKPRVFRTRREGADAVRENRPMTPEDAHELGRFVERQQDFASNGYRTAREVEVE